MASIEKQYPPRRSFVGRNAILDILIFRKVKCCKISSKVPGWPLEERRQQRFDHRRSSHHLTTSCNQNESRYGVTIIGNFLCRSCEPIYRFRDLCAYCKFRNRDSASWSFFAIARVGDRHSTLGHLDSSTVGSDAQGRRKEGQGTQRGPHR